MSFSLYRRSKSARVTVTTPEGTSVVVENLRGDVGASIKFSVKITMDQEPGEMNLSLYNLPDDALGIIEYAQTRQVNDVDRMLSGLELKTGVVSSDGDDGIKAGFCRVEIEAGYDGVMSRVFRAIGAQITSGPVDGGLTQETVIKAEENLDAVLLGAPLQVFPAGAATYDLVDYLRQVAGLGPGNLSKSTFSAILGDSKLDSGYHMSGGQALSHLRNVLQYLALRWFIEDRELWICGRDDQPNAGQVPAYIADLITEPDLLLERPRRVDGGRVRVVSLLCPRVRVGRLVRLSPGGLDLALQGLSPSAKQQALARVPPGLYRLDEVEHDGDTSGEAWTTTMLLRAGVAMGA